MQAETKQLKALKKERTRRKTSASAEQVTNDTMVERFVVSEDEAPDLAQQVFASNCPDFR